MSYDASMRTREECLETLSELLAHGVVFAGLLAARDKLPDNRLADRMHNAMDYGMDCVLQDISAAFYLTWCVSFIELQHILNCPTCRLEYERYPCKPDVFKKLYEPV